MGRVLSVVAFTIGAAVMGCAITPPAEGSLEDAVSDQTLQGTGESRDGPEFADLRTLRASADRTGLTMTLVLAADLPLVDVPTIRRVSYSFFVHTEGGSGTSYIVQISLINPALHRFTLYETRGGDQVPFTGPAFPGRHAVGTDGYVITIPLHALGDPDVIRLAAGSFATGGDPDDPPEAMSTTEDFLPDSGIAADSDWLTLRP